MTLTISKIPIFQQFFKRNNTSSAPAMQKNVFSQTENYNRLYPTQDDYSRTIEYDMFSVPEFKDFTQKERKKISKKIAQCYGDYESLIGVLRNKKPSVVIDYRFDCLSKIQKNDINVVLSDESSFVFNKKAIKEIIKKNKFLYTNSFNMNKFATVNMVYSRLIQEMKKDNLDSDVLGVTLGFPLLDSMIFMLDRKTGYSGRQDMREFKRRLLNYLNQDDSVYKNLPRKELKQLKDAIKGISQVEYYDDGITSYVKFV